METLFKSRFARKTLFSILFAAAVTLSVVPTGALAKGTLAEKEIPAVCDEIVNGKSYSVSKIVVHAKPEHVWRVLTDYKNACSVFPQLRKCETLEEKGATKILKHKIQPSGLAGCTYEYVLEVRETAPRTLEWHRLSGDFKSVDGLWKLEPTNAGHDTLVTYSSYVNGGVFIPQFMIKRQSKIDMPDVLANLKSESEANALRIAKRDSVPTQ
jgi:ribosome-associated toxin RatA of RatAB toxin-antitoxin module